MIIPKNWWQRTLIAVVAIGLFIAGYYFHDWTSQNVQFKVVSVNTPENVSTAISDRWDLITTDLKTGKVRIFNREILNGIYYQYRARLTYTQEDKIPGE